MTTRPTGVVTFLFTDIEGSTALWAREPEAMREALEQHDIVLRSGIQQAAGHVFSTAGDSFSATFQQPSEAVDAAIELQQSLRATIWAGGLDVRIRMGLHLGVADERDGNYFGSAVNLAARVCEAAHGGQILVSGALAHHVRGHELLDLGEHRLRGFDQSHRLLQVSVPGPAVSFPPVRTQSPALRLPAVRAFLIGREEAVREIRGLLAAHRLVTLTGTGGVGKTSLAVEIASREATRVMVGKQGYIKDVVTVAPPIEEDADYDPLAFKLYPEPEKPGFYAVGFKNYIHLSAKRIRIVGTELKHYAGVQDFPEEAVPQGSGRTSWSTTTSTAH